MNFVVIPYRDRYFLERYGNAVRDLHIIQALSRSPAVAALTVVNRPVTLHERALRLKLLADGSKPHLDFPGAEWLTTADFDFIGPVRKRRWLEHCYDPLAKEIAALKKDGHLNVLLDFSPLSKIDYRSLGFDVVWYDAIDNFSKHNRFSPRERELVSEKYQSVSHQVDIVTAVSKGAAEPMMGARRVIVLPNGLPADRSNSVTPPTADAHDFGFMGFVTDKFDVDVVRRLSMRGYTTAIHGDVYDKRVALELGGVPGVKLYGAFKHNELGRVCSSFKVGLIPYLKTKLHDESPLKLYQYLSRGRPVLCSVPYEIENEFVQVYGELSDDQLYHACNKFLSQSASPERQQAMASSISQDAQWDSKISTFISHMRNLQAST